MRELIDFIEERIRIMDEAACGCTAKPNPWGHRATELRLVLEKARSVEPATTTGEKT